VDADVFEVLPNRRQVEVTVFAVPDKIGLACFGSRADNNTSGRVSVAKSFIALGMETIEDYAYGLLLSVFIDDFVFEECIDVSSSQQLTLQRNLHSDRDKLTYR
jgi:hypothetical protein